MADIQISICYKVLPAKVLNVKFKMVWFLYCLRKVESVILPAKKKY